MGVRGRGVLHGGWIPQLEETLDLSQFFFVTTHTWQRVPSPYFMKTPCPYIVYPLFQNFLNLPSCLERLHPHALFVFLFLWLNGWLREWVFFCWYSYLIWHGHRSKVTQHTQRPIEWHTHIYTLTLYMYIRVWCIFSKFRRENLSFRKLMLGE